MAIVRMGGSTEGGGAGMARRVGLKAAKKGAKHPAKKHPAKKLPGEKHAAKKHAEKAGKKSAGDRSDAALPDSELALAFHHLQRAAAIISLLEQDSGSDLRRLLESGIELYRRASGAKSERNTARCASGLLRAAEHLGMAGLYAARGAYRVEVEPPPHQEIQRHLNAVSGRLVEVPEPERETGLRLLSIARELLRRAQAGGDPHLVYELTMAAAGLCTALEAGV
jgi:hypothetical protein